MIYSDNFDTTPRTDRSTITVISILALTAAAGAAFCLVYSIWWLVTFWAPA